MRHAGARRSLSFSRVNLTGVGPLLKLWVGGPKPTLGGDGRICPVSSLHEKANSSRGGGAKPGASTGEAAQLPNGG